jgi:hypothetical protein
VLLEPSWLLLSLLLSLSDEDLLMLTLSKALSPVL